jgi:hypothetical protein
VQDQVADHDADRDGRGEAEPAVVMGNMARQKFAHPEAVQEVV